MWYGCGSEKLEKQNGKYVSGIPIARAQPTLLSMSSRGGRSPVSHPVAIAVVGSMFFYPIVKSGAVDIALLNIIGCFDFENIANLTQCRLAVRCTQTVIQQYIGNIWT